MWASWFVLGMVMIATTRWFSYANSYFNYVHVLTGLIIVAANFKSAIFIFILNGWKRQGLHNLLGQILIVSLLAFAATGITTFWIKKKTNWNTNSEKKARRIHKYMALSIWLFSILTMTFGIKFYLNRLPPDVGAKYEYLMAVNIVAMLAIAIGFEINY